MLLPFSGCVGERLEAFTVGDLSFLIAVLVLDERSDFWTISPLLLLLEELSSAAFGSTATFDALLWWFLWEFPAWPFSSLFALDVSFRSTPLAAFDALLWWLPGDFPAWPFSSFVALEVSVRSTPLAAATGCLVPPCWPEAVLAGFTIINWGFCLDGSSLVLTVCTGTKMLPWMRYICPVVVLATMTCWLVCEDFPLAMMVALIGAACCWVGRVVAVFCCIVWIPSVLFSTTGAFSLSTFALSVTRSSSSEDKRSSHLKEGTFGLSFFSWGLAACSPSVLWETTSLGTLLVPSLLSVLMSALCSSDDGFPLLTNSLTSASLAKVCILFASSSKSLFPSSPTVLLLSPASAVPDVPGLASAPALPSWPVALSKLIDLSTLSSICWLVFLVTETFCADLMSDLADVSLVSLVSRSTLLVLSTALPVPPEVSLTCAPILSLLSSSWTFFTGLLCSLSPSPLLCTILLINSSPLPKTFWLLETSLPSLRVLLTIPLALLDKTSLDLIGSLALLSVSPLFATIASPSFRSSLSWFTIDWGDFEIVCSPTPFSVLVLLASLGFRSSPTLPEDSSPLLFDARVSPWSPSCILGEWLKTSVLATPFDPLDSFDFFSAFSSMPSLLPVGGDTDWRSALEALLFWRGTPFWPSATFCEVTAFCLKEHCTEFDTVSVVASLGPWLGSLLGGETFTFLATGFFIELLSSKPSWPALEKSGLFGFGEGVLDGGDLLRGDEGICTVFCCPGYEARRRVTPPALVPAISCCDW